MFLILNNRSCILDDLMRFKLYLRRSLLCLLHPIRRLYSRVSIVSSNTYNIHIDKIYITVYSLRTVFTSLLYISVFTTPKWEPFLLLLYSRCYYSLVTYHSQVIKIFSPSYSYKLLLYSLLLFCYPLLMTTQTPLVKCVTPL